MAETNEKEQSATEVAGETRHDLKKLSGVTKGFFGEGFMFRVARAWEGDLSWFEIFSDKPDVKTDKADAKGRSFTDTLKSWLGLGDKDDSPPPPSNPDDQPPPSPLGGVHTFFDANDPGARFENPKFAPFRKYQAFIMEASAEFNVPASVILRTFWFENAQANPKAHNRSGAHGLGQHILSTWYGLGGTDENRDDPRTQIRLTAKYLRQQHDRWKCKDWLDAIMYYHTGGPIGSSFPLQAAYRQNPPIRRIMEQQGIALTPEGYMKGARLYYGQTV